METKDLERRLMTFRELCEACWKHNDENNITQQYSDKKPLICYVVVNQMPYWKEQFSEQQRTYRFRSDNKRFISRMCGNSIFADCLDGKDLGVRLDWYIGDWTFEKCWYEESEESDNDD